MNVPREAGREGSTKTLRAFFGRVEGLTDDPVHVRLIGAARKKDPEVALEKELKKVIQEILDEA